MPPLCAENNTNRNVHQSISTGSMASPRSEVSLLAIAQQLLQQKQPLPSPPNAAVNHRLLHPYPLEPDHSTQAQLSTEVPVSDLQWQPSKTAQDFNSYILHHSTDDDTLLCDDFSAYDTNSLQSFPLSSSQILSPLDQTPMSAKDHFSAKYADQGMGMGMAPFEITTSALSCQTLNSMDERNQDHLHFASTAEMASCDWVMDCLMYDLEGQAIASCFIDQTCIPCESSTQSSDKSSAMAASTSYNNNSNRNCNTPLEEALPDDFTVLEEAMAQISSPWKLQRHHQKAHDDDDNDEEEEALIAHQNYNSGASEDVSLLYKPTRSSNSFTNSLTGCFVNESRHSQQQQEQAISLQQRQCATPVQQISPYVSLQQQKISHVSMPSTKTSSASLQQQKASSSSVSSHGIELMKLLLECAKSVEEDQERAAMLLLPKLEALSSRHGDPIQRLAAYFTEGLWRRLEGGEQVEEEEEEEEEEGKPELQEKKKQMMRMVLRRKKKKKKWMMKMKKKIEAEGEAEGEEEEEEEGFNVMAYKAMNEMSPFFTFAELTANQIILDALGPAMADQHIHIVDFGLGHGTQWASLLQAMGTSTGTETRSHNNKQIPRLVTITAVRLPGQNTENLGMAMAVGRRLAEFGRSVGLSVEWKEAEADLASIGARDHESVVVNFMQSLGSLLPPRGCVGDCPDILPSSAVRDMLVLAARLKPKVVTVAEMDADLDRGPFQRRFVNALHFFSAMFDSIEAAGMGRDSAQRLLAERIVLGDMIESVVGGLDNAGPPPGYHHHHHRRPGCRRRLMSHESWRQSLVSSGFRPNPLSGYSLSQARILLWRFCDSFTLHEHQQGSLTLGWQSKPLFTVSSWTL